MTTWARCSWAVSLGNLWRCRSATCTFADLRLLDALLLSNGDYPRLLLWSGTWRARQALAHVPRLPPGNRAVPTRPRPQRFSRVSMVHDSPLLRPTEKEFGGTLPSKIMCVSAAAFPDLQVEGGRRRTERIVPVQVVHRGDVHGPPADRGHRRDGGRVPRSR